jgi:hypothetical protein
MRGAAPVKPAHTNGTDHDAVEVIGSVTWNEHTEIERRPRKGVGLGKERGETGRAGDGGGFCSRLEEETGRLLLGRKRQLSAKHG